MFIGASWAPATGALMSYLSIPDEEKNHALGCTATQGQYLAYIYAYTTIHRRPPAETDMQDFFRVTPPSVHNMVLTLERHGFIDRVPGQARSITLRVPPEALPILR
jgi:DNA-binding MarR family transcriptional regulator